MKGIKMSWIEKDNYWILKTEQRSPLWFKARLGRCTSSIISACIGRNKYKTPQEALKEIKGECTIFCNSAMKHGIKYEDEARRIYQEHKNISVEQIGLAVPKWNKYIGCSTDGLVGDDGMIEIKCPVRFYKNLTQMEKTKEYEKLIDINHYIQMQCGLAVLDRKWCDYVIYYPEITKIYIFRVYFNKIFWDSVHDELQKFIKENKIDKIEVLLPSNSN